MTSAGEGEAQKRLGSPAARGAPLAIRVIAADPLLNAGAAALLHDWPGTTLVGEDDVTDGTVVVLVTATFDDAAEAAFAPLRRRARVTAVLVPEALDGESLSRAIESGVRAVVWRHEARQRTLRSAVATVAAGQGRLPPDLTGVLMTRSVRGHPRAQQRFGRRVTLSPRELEVLRLIADGYDTHEIAERLAYSERTIKAILHDVTTRLQLKNRAHAVAYLIRHGVV